MAKRDEHSGYWAMALLNADNELLVVRCTEAQMAGATTLGTKHREIKRAYGPLGKSETIQDVADIYAARWYPISTRIVFWC